MDDGGMFWWMLAMGVSIIYCVARAIVDLRQRRYAWAAVGLISAAILVLMPIKTHAVIVDLPMSNGG